jgi:hypothetical protein
VIIVNTCNCNIVMHECRWKCRRCLVSTNRYAERECAKCVFLVPKRSSHDDAK